MHVADDDSAPGRRIFWEEFHPDDLELVEVRRVDEIDLGSQGVLEGGARGFENFGEQGQDAPRLGAHLRFPQVGADRIGADDGTGLIDRVER